MMPGLTALLLAFAMVVEPEVDLADLDRFPNGDRAYEAMSINRRWSKHLQDRADGLGGYEAEQLGAAVVDAQRRYDVWSLLQCARMPYWGDAMRLQDLRQLRATIGYPAYYRGEMPSPIELSRWRID